MSVMPEPEELGIKGMKVHPPKFRQKYIRSLFLNRAGEIYFTLKGPTEKAFGWGLNFISGQDKFRRAN